MRLNFGFYCNLKAIISESKVFAASFFTEEFRISPGLGQKIRKAHFVLCSDPVSGPDESLQSILDMVK